MSFRLNPNHVILLALTSGKVTSLAFSKVHPAALATHAFKDLPRMNLVLVLIPHWYMAPRMLIP